MPTARRVRAGNGGVAAHPETIGMLALLVLIAWFWVGLVDDQMPCFLGVPNCD
jgi:hypothetical protein